jgi:hypothetical protein
MSIAKFFLAAQRKFKKFKKFDEEAMDELKLRFVYCDSQGLNRGAPALVHSQPG